MWAVVAIFAVTYVLIAGRRLALIPIGRPAGALVGACAMVALSAFHPAGLLPHEAFAAVEANTIGLLLGMMLLAAALAEAGLLERAAAWIEARGLTPVALLYAVTLGSGVLSALLLNDSVCLLLTPVVDRAVRRAGLARAPYLLAVAMGANAGSAMTLAGNPQNMLVAHLSGMSYAEYLGRAGPAGALALAATAVTLHAVTRSSLAERREPAGEPEPPSRSQRGMATRRWAPLVCLGALVVAFLAGGNLAWSALGAATAVILLQGRDPARLFQKVSWTVLVFFGALFVVVGGLQKAGVPGALMRWALPLMPDGAAGALIWLSAVVVAGCQAISNVPFILLAEPLIRSMPDPSLAWTVVAVVSTLAGNLTLLGSVANVIVVETAGAEKELGFRAYLRVGVPVTLVSVAIALGWLLVVR